MTTKDELQVDSLLCLGSCNHAQYPNTLKTLLTANSGCKYITEWVVQHLSECNGPTIANLVGGGSSIYMPNRKPKVVFTGR